MAANNYFGFTHGGTQYSTTPAATYQPGQPGYAVGHATQTYAAAPRTGQTAAYEGYQTTHATGTYGYGSRQQDAAPPPPPAANPTYETYGYARTVNTPGYDGTKTYYPQPAQTPYSATETTTHYQAAAKPAAYTTNANFTAAARPVANPKTPANTQAYGYAAASGTPSYTTNYGSTPTTTAYSGTTYSGYDAALYTAATVYVQQQQQASTTPANKNAAGWAAYKKGNMKTNKPKQPPKPQQLHYCDVCKISCAGPQTYREHLEGQKHKKKEAAAKAGTAAQSARGGNSLRCELCDVTCTGADAYAAHIRGAKHQKVVKLHTKLGKPIPSTEPVVVTNNNSGAPVNATINKLPTVVPGGVMMGGVGDVVVPKKIIATPKITFIGGTKLSTTATNTPAPPPVPEMKESPKIVNEEQVKEESGKVGDFSKMEDKPEIQPVGQDYIEEIKNDEGKVISFQCKLCECRFNDPNAKEMHMKGRRHRLQYKKKVNPDLIVDIKPSLRQRKLQEEKLRRQQMKEEFWRRREEERMMEEEERLYWEERRRYEEEMEYYEWYRRYGRDMRGLPPPPRPFPAQMQAGPPMPMRRPDTSDDRHVVAKHAQIYPKEEELQAVQKIITNTEKALKLVSDHLAENEPLPKKEMPKELTEIKVEPPDESAAKNECGDGDASVCLTAQPPPPPPPPAPRTLKGVMRVGVLAKGLLLHGDLNVDLAVMCSEKPTASLLDKVADILPGQLASVTEEKYEIKRCKEEAAIVIMTTDEPKTSVTITLTSPVMRETNHLEGGESVNVKDPPDVLDRQKCLDALAALRHAKWFQARANGLQSCVMIIRILRDLCQRVPTWAPLNSWAMELLVEKVISSAGQPLSPGDALRRVFEAIASGILLPGGPGLLDPCEKDPVDAGSTLSNQEREDITASAQHALRLLAFRQIHKVLGMDQLPPPKFIRPRFNRKRRRDNSSGEGTEEGADGKKDKKDEIEKSVDTMEVQDGEVKG